MANKSTVTFINTSAEVKKTLEGLSKTALNASGKIIMEKIKDNIPIRSKNFRNHIGKWAFIGRKDGVPKMQIGFYGWQTVKKKHKTPSNMSPHWVEFGTKAHQIKAKNAKALGYKGMYGEIVNHPGTIETHILRDTVYNNMSEIRAAQEQYLAEITKTIEKAKLQVNPKEELGDDD